MEASSSGCCAVSFTGQKKKKSALGTSSQVFSQGLSKQKPNLPPLSIPSAYSSSNQASGPAWNCSYQGASQEPMVEDVSSDSAFSSDEEESCRFCKRYFCYCYCHFCANIGYSFCTCLDFARLCDLVCKESLPASPVIKESSVSSSENVKVFCVSKDNPQWTHIASPNAQLQFRISKT